LKDCSIWRAGYEPRRETVAYNDIHDDVVHHIVQPAVMGAAGMDPGAVMVATCIASALGTVLMALLANYPIAIAPAMGHNFYFTYIVVLTLGYSWQNALGAVFIAGLVFILLSTGLRETLMNVLPGH
jgi:AGZA family xanthine/uracil permease-like MFS transporter